MEDPQGSGDGAKLGGCGVTKERNSLTILIVFLSPPANADGRNGRRGGIGDVEDLFIVIAEEDKVVLGESHRRL